MPLKASIAANAVQEQSGAKQLGAPYSPRTRFWAVKSGQIIRGLVRRGADELFQALVLRTASGDCSVVAPETDLAKQLSVTDRTIRSNIRSLEAAGLISTRREWQYNRLKKQKTLCNRYTFHDHPVLRQYMGDDRPQKTATYTAPVTPPTESARPAPIPIRPPAPPAPPQPVPLPPAAATSWIPPGMAAVCWPFNGTLMYMFIPIEPAPDVAPPKPKPTRSTNGKGTHNPIPDTDPYYPAVRIISNAKFFRTKDRTCFEDVHAEFTRLNLTPELAVTIAREIVRSGTFEFSLIDDLSRSYHSAGPIAVESSTPVAPEVADCEECGDSGVSGDNRSNMVFCSCVHGQERKAQGWLPEYEGPLSGHWRDVFHRSNVSLDRKPPEREHGPTIFSEVKGNTS